jgi:hypothetical protein
MAATRCSKETAEASICRALNDGAIKFRAQLQEHATRHVNSKRFLLGEAFDLPVVKKPSHLDWENSKPNKPLVVIRGADPLAGRWFIARIELSRSDVTILFCHLPDRADTSLTAPKDARQPDGESDRSTMAEQKAQAAGPGRRRGRRPVKLEATIAAMKNDLEGGRLTAQDMSDMKEKELERRYDVSRDTARKARNTVLGQRSS